ncbi:MAG TPA: site-2 protease family protein [Pseudolabrys sp.]|nr:site-2 protease family protein [Pseudolabrys sp.]
MNLFAYEVSIWLIPVLLAITFHEAAHGLVAHWLGDDTAWNLGRVSFNPLVHVDPFGTVLLPGLLLASGAPFLFGYAKPVPVKFAALRHPRRDMMLVAAAGPLMNLLLAIIAALAIHLVPLVPGMAAEWLARNLQNALVLNVVLMVFNLLPIPPLDGGRIITGLLPRRLAVPFASIERFGMLPLLALIFLLPMLGAEFDVVARVIGRSTEFVLRIILHLTANV